MYPSEIIKVLPPSTMEEVKYPQDTSPIVKKVKTSLDPVQDMTIDCTECKNHYGEIDENVPYAQC